MYKIIIVCNNSSMPAALDFKTKELADAQYQNIHEAQTGSSGVTIITAKDEYGVTLSVDVKNISYAVLGDADKQMELQMLQGGPRK